MHGNCRKRRNFLWKFEKSNTKTLMRTKETKNEKGFIKKARKWIGISCDPWPPHLFPTLWKRTRLGEETTMIEYVGALFLVTGTVINKVDQSKTEEEAMETEEASPQRAKWVMDKCEEHPDSALCHMDGSLEDPRSCLRRMQVEFRGWAPYNSENGLN